MRNELSSAIKWLNTNYGRLTYLENLPDKNTDQWAELHRLRYGWDTNYDIVLDHAHNDSEMAANWLDTDYKSMQEEQDAQTDHH